MKILPVILLYMLFGSCLQAQVKQKENANHCATMQVLEDKFSRDPQFKTRFENQRAEFQRIITEVAATRVASSDIQNRTQAVVNIPVVFHVVLSNSLNVTDAQIQAQLDTLNLDYAGDNGDSVRIPSYFKPYFGKSIIRFCLAQQDPDGLPSSGINHIATSQTSFTTNNDVKHAATGGADAWNTEKYLNVWLCALSNNILGYATFPNDNNPSEQGVVIDYRSLPGGSFTGYNNGKTMTHEIGHYFNLYHIWGDDNGACNGTDFIDDTPNQADFTSGSPTGVKTDNCSPAAPGVMYQNYMDYTTDVNLVMFTNMQVARMETSLNVYRASLLSSGGCSPAVLKSLDIQLKSVDEPAQRICTGAFSPVITIKNAGTQTINAVTIYSQLDNGPVNTFNWTGTLNSLSVVSVTLNSLTTSNGNHTLTIYTANPNNSTDQNFLNDTLRVPVSYQQPITANLQEGFESSTFPPVGWDIVNSDNSYTWERITGVAKTGNASVYIRNFDYSISGRKDYLRLPETDAAGLDSLFMSFQVAAAAYTATSTANNVWDTLEVVVSTDCGKTYTSVYKKWGATLVTRTAATTNSFVPNSSEWRKDSVNLSSFIQQGRLIVAFLNTTGFENNIYLDDVNLRRVSVNPNLKDKGVLVTPNPTFGNIAVQFYPQPTGLRSIQIYSIAGQKVQETIIQNDRANNYYSYDLSRFAAGTYLVRIVFNDRVIVKKIINR